MARLIKFKAQCSTCARWFEKGQAYLQLMPNRRWYCHCFECYKKKKEE